MDQAKACLHPKGLILCAVGGCTEAIHQIIQENIKFFFHFALKFRRRYSRAKHVPVQELVNICVVTFIEKISKFDPVHASGAKPFTYLGFWMWQAMQRALPDLVDESGRTVSSSRRINSRSVPVTFFIQSLFAPVNHDEDSTLCETIPDPDSVASDVAADERRAGIVVRHLLREFGPLERMIIEARYYEGKTLEETADVVHALGLTKRRLSREAIRQNEKRTLERLGLALVRTGLAQ